MEITTDNYFEYRLHNGIPVLSSSMLKNATAIKAGNVRRIRAYFNKEMDKSPTKYMNFGSLIHKYSETPEKFVIEPEWSMSEAVKNIVDNAIQTLINTGVEIDNDITAHKELLFICCRELKWGQSYKDEVRLKKICDPSAEYWAFKKNSQDSIIVTGKEAEHFNKVIESVNKSELAIPILRDHPQLETHREKAILVNIKTIYGDFPVKALFDIVEFDDEKKKAVITDIKTTSYPVEQFITRYSYTIDSNAFPVKSMIGSDYVKYMYYFQEYLYKTVLDQYMYDQNIEDYDISFRFAVIETNPPYLCKFITINPVWSAIAKEEFDFAMEVVGEWFLKDEFAKF